MSTGFLGTDFDPTAPPDTEAASNGATRIRDIKQRLKTFFGVLFDLESGNLLPNIVPSTALLDITPSLDTATTFLHPSLKVNSKGQIVLVSEQSAGDYKAAGSVETPATGGTGLGLAPSTGQLLIGRTAGTYALATLTSGTGITVTNADGSVTISLDFSVLTSIPFNVSATLTSATAATAIQLLADLASLSPALAARQVFLEGFLARVDGGTAWTTTTAVTIQDSAGTPNSLVTIPVANLTANATLGPWTSGITLQPTFVRGVGCAAGKGLKIVGDVNAGAGSNLIVQAWGVLR